MKERTKVLKDLDQRRREDEGFTLIELMVVVLIMGILMAIAIPTFLSTRGAAYDATAKSNATNAFTGEKAYYQDNQVFLDLSVSGGTTMDNSLPWANGAVPASGTVTADAYNEAAGVYTAQSGAGKTGNAVLIMAEAKSSDNCFYISDTEDTSGATPVIILGYAESSGGCAAPAFPTAALLNATGNAGAHIVAGAPTDADWYPSW
jgi:type IV pilus assembly protein PilA